MITRLLQVHPAVRVAGYGLLGVTGVFTLAGIVGSALVLLSR